MGPAIDLVMDALVEFDESAGIGGRRHHIDGEQEFVDLGEVFIGTTCSSQSSGERLALLAHL